MRRSLVKPAARTVVAALALLLVAPACGGEDRPGVEVIENGSGTGTGTGTGTGSGTGSGTATGSVEEGVVEPPPASATGVAVELTEWAVNLDSGRAPAGQVYFLVENAGAEPHEFVVIRTDEPAEDLPVEDGKVPEDRVDVVDEIEPFAAGSSASIALDLAPGRYALICNIAGGEHGEHEGSSEGHFELGMFTSFVVE